MTEPILNAADAVAALGALPVPVGPEPRRLLAERHSTNEALDDAVQELRARRADVEAPYVSRLLPPRGAVCARPGCGHQGVEHHHGDTKCWAHLPRTRDRFGAWSGITICGCSGFVAAPSVEESADKLTQLLAPTQALREDEPEAPHPAPCRWPSSPDCTCLEDGAE